jgi:hypothetical protein
MPNRDTQQAFLSNQVIIIWLRESLLRSDALTTCVTGAEKKSVRQRTTLVASVVREDTYGNRI